MSDDTCTRMLEDGHHCGGALSRPIRGRFTGRWFRTCRRCGETTSQPAGPAPAGERLPIGWRLAHDLPLTWQARHEGRQDAPGGDES